MNGVVLDPAKSKLFTVHKILSLSGVAQAEFFHSMTVSLLIATKQTRPDMQVVVVYMCTRVQEPTEDNYSKLAIIIQYLCATVHLPLVISWDGTGKLLWSIDASFVVSITTCTVILE